MKVIIFNSSCWVINFMLKTENTGKFALWFVFLYK
jgi:hypothetical protein